MKKFLDFLSISGYVLGAGVCIFFAWIYMPEETNASRFYSPTCTHSGVVTVVGASFYPNFTCSGVNYGTGYNSSGIFPAINNTFFFSTEKELFGLCSYTGTTATSKSGFNCPAKIDAKGGTGATGATGSSITGATGPQGLSITGSTGPSGLDAYEIAVIMGFTGSISEWLDSLRGETGATGSIDFSTLSGTINLSNVVNIPNTDGTLSSSGVYFSLFTYREGTYYANWEGIRNILAFFAMIMIIFFLTIKVFNIGKR